MISIINKNNIIKESLFLSIGFLLFLSSEEKLSSLENNFNLIQNEATSLSDKNKKNYEILSEESENIDRKKDWADTGFCICHQPYDKFRDY
ncbi:MAG: hypothetical protein ABIA04_07420 [Pseudomonadota bacterium]